MTVSCESEYKMSGFSRSNRRNAWISNCWSGGRSVTTNSTDSWSMEIGEGKKIIFQEISCIFCNFYSSVSWTIEVGKEHYLLFTDRSFFIFHFFLLLLMPQAWSMVIRKGPLFTFHGLSSPRWSTTWIMAPDLFVSLLAFRWTARSALWERLLVRTFTLTFVLQVASVSPVSQSKGVGAVSFQDGVCIMQWNIWTVNLQVDYFQKLIVCSYLQTFCKSH